MLLVLAGRLLWLGIAAAVLFFVTYGHSYVAWEELGRHLGRSIGLGLLLLLALGLVFAGSTMLVTLGRKLELVESDDQAIKVTDEPVVVYLRSFAQDRRSEVEWANQATSLQEGLVPILAGTAEERLLRRLRVFGRVVAVGRPGESLPTRGAARVYVDDENWQDTVRRLMARAVLVLIAPDGTPGVRWELDAALRGVSPNQLVLVFFRAATAWAHVEEICARLGYPPPVAGRMPFAMSFAPDWAPEILLERDKNGAVIHETLFYVLMDRWGLNDLLKQEVRHRIFGGLLLLCFGVMTPFALAIGGVLRVALIAVGVLLFVWSIRDGRPAIGSFSVLGLALLFLAYTSLQWGPFGALGVAALALGLFVSAFVELVESPSGRLAQGVAARLRN